jgi:hypothetical protein
MTPILATVLKVDKLGNEYVVIVQLGNEDFSGRLEELSFENKPDQGWCHYGWLDLIYHRDPDLRAGQIFPLWSASAIQTIVPRFPQLSPVGNSQTVSDDERRN